MKADASVNAANIEAQAQVQSAAIYAKARAGNPELYDLLRSLDTLNSVITPGTQLVLRTDAAPFKQLAEGPPALPANNNGPRP
jgi:membrane protease subunit HflC